MAMASVPNMGDMAALSPLAEPTEATHTRTSDGTIVDTSVPEESAQEAATLVENNGLEMPLVSRKPDDDEDDGGDHANAEQHQEHVRTLVRVEAEPLEQDDETESEVEYEIEAIEDEQEDEQADDDDSDQEQKTSHEDHHDGRTGTTTVEQEFPPLELLAPTHWNTAQNLDAFGAELAKANHRNSVSGPHKKGKLATLSLLADEALMRSILEKEQQFADVSVARRPLWESIAAASGGSFPTGGSARMRVKWLSEVLNDENHREHSKLSSELKTMIRTFREARQNDDPALLKKARKATSREVVTRAEDSPLVVNTVTLNVAAAEEKKPVTETGQATLDPALEEKFLAAALYHVEALATSERREKVWDLIVKDAGGRFEFGSQARHRMMWLIKIFTTPEHREHKRLTLKLKQMLRTFLGFKPFQKLPRSKESKGKGKSKQKSTSKVSKHTKKKGDKSNAPKVKMGGEDAWLTIQPEMDELLIELVIEKRPFKADRYQKPVVWAEIAQAVANPRLKDGSSGMGRCRWLVSVLENPSHDEHANLTFKLRQFLRIYVEMYNEHLKKRAADKSRDVDTSQATTVGATSKSSKAVETPLNSFPGEEVIRLPREDSALLREVLTVRPFHKNEETRTALWQSVADNMADTLGSKKAFPTGASCHERVGVLLRMMHNPAALAQFKLTEDELEMLRLLESMVKTRWMNLKRLQTENHRLLTVKIEGFLARTNPQSTPTQSGKPQMPRSQRMTPPLEPEVNHLEIESPTQESESQPPNGQPKSPNEDRVVLVAEEAEPLHEERERRHRAHEAPRRRRRDERVAEEEETKGDDKQDGERHHSHKRRRKSHETRHHRDVPATSLVLDEDQIHALQAEIVRLRSLCALSEADRKAFKTKIKMMQDEVQSCRDQLTRQSTKLEYERRDHRQELRAMVAMMQTEREAHQRETKAMLEAINKEIDDRKNEFVAMMNLVTRSAAQPPSNP